MAGAGAAPGEFLRVFVAAGEPSGDELGARLMAALRERCGGQVRFAGVGGPAMEAEGLASLFPMSELSVIGLFEILPHMRRLLARIRETAAAIDAMTPDVVVTIDSPGFAHRVVQRVRNRSIPRVHYVAPTVWAWRPWRVRGIRRDFDMVLCLLPFEAPFFEKAGVPCRFVGHPVVEYGAADGDGPAFRKKYGIAEDDTVICMLLGSRRSEVTRLAQPFAGALALLRETHPSLKAVVPTVAGVAGLVRELCDGFPVPTLVVQGREDKFGAMAASDAALAKSGTVALEIALARLPGVIAYKVSPLTAMLLRRLALIRFVNLINIVRNREVVPERLQENCTPEILAAEIETLLGPAGAVQIDEAAVALAALGAGGTLPSRRAADAVLEVARARPG
jgi:lipid-A-disaccharide synthase